MNKIAKYFSVIILVALGVGYSLFLYFTRLDYLSDALTAKGVVENVYGIRKTNSYISNTEGSQYYDQEISSEGRTVNREYIMKLVSKGVIKDVEGTKFERTPSLKPIDESRKDSTILLEITPNKRLEIKIIYLQYLMIGFDLNTDQGLYTFIPSLRNISEKDKGFNKMSTFFQKILATSDTLELIGSEDKHYSDIGLLTGNKIFGVDKISNHQGQELYFFPYNSEYNTKISYITITIIMTTIMSAIFFLSIVFGWKGNG